jgi:hypothetical protein
LGANSRQRCPPPCARLTRAVGAQCPRGRTPSRRRDAAATLGRHWPATISASATRLTRAVGAHGPRGHTPPSRRDGAGAFGRKQPAKISASAACLARAVGANGPRGHTPCPQSARRLSFNCIHPIRTPAPRARHISPTQYVWCQRRHRPSRRQHRRTASRQQCPARHHPTGGRMQLGHGNATAGTEGAAVWRSRRRRCCAQRDAVNLRQGRVKGKGEL